MKLSEFVHQYFVMFPHQGCINLIEKSKNSKICEILLQFKIAIFYVNIL